MQKHYLTQRVTAFVESLDADELSFIYFGGARLWLDTANRELAITFGPPDDETAHDVSDLPCVGQWVYAALEPSLADEHPRRDDGIVDYEWPGLADWERQWLLYCVHQIVRTLSSAAKQSFNAFLQARTGLASFKRRGQSLN